VRFAIPHVSVIDLVAALWAWTARGAVSFDIRAERAQSRRRVARPFSRRFAVDLVSPSAPAVFRVTEEEAEMFRPDRASTAIALLLVAGCSSNVTTENEGNTTTGGPDPTPQSYSVEFGPITVPPGTERTQCVTKRLGNPAAMHVGRIHNVLEGPSHHLIVYKTAATIEQPEPVDCQPFTDTLKPEKGSPLVITQKHEEILELPAGIAFTLDADQMIRLEMHYINAGAGDLDVKATSTFEPMPDSEFKDEAGFLFVGNPDIEVPANSAVTLGPSYLALAPLFYDTQIFGVTGHTHQWGTSVKVALAEGPDGPDTPIYDVADWSWSEPLTSRLDPPMTAPKGGGFRFSCSWENKGTSNVYFGESANDEMCFFWAYYYPNQGSFVCIHTDQVQGGYDFCCPGSPICSMIF
jgi:hypothetical protein